jgi:hypothetical protein
LPKVVKFIEAERIVGREIWRVILDGYTASVLQDNNQSEDG